VIDIRFGALLYSLEAENNPVANDGLIGPQLEDRGALKILPGRIWNYVEPNDLRQNPVVRKNYITPQFRPPLQ
jgi:hypothetical protein